MEKQKMTIHRALSELKLIDSKIKNQIDEFQPTGIHQKGKLIDGRFPEKDFETVAQSKFQSITDLIARKQGIKTAIVAANGITKVKVAEKEMTIADAITFKTNVSLKKALLQRMKGIYTNSLAAMNKNNDMAEKNVQVLLEATFGKENVKVTATDMDAVRKPFMESNEFHLFDPLKIAEKIELLEKEIGDFEAEVDAVLSEINAITFIEV